MSARDETLGATCAVPLLHSTVQLAHGGGGRAMRELIERVFLPAFENPVLTQRHDSAVLPQAPGRLALTNDAYVVRPLFFPGGDIGTLAVNGTVNDLAMSGAVPEYLCASFILEEGFEIAALQRVVASMAAAAKTARVSIVAGDTKVVDRGHGDGVYVVTSGVGRVPDGVHIGPARVEPGDAILVNGDVGRHGIAVLSVREGLAFGTHLESDCAELSSMVQALIRGGVVPHCLRDLTRGGLAAALCELALDADLEIEIDERRIPISDAVRGASEPWTRSAVRRLRGQARGFRSRRPGRARGGTHARSRGGTQPNRARASSLCQRTWLGRAREHFWGHSPRRALLRRAAATNLLSEAIIPETVNFRLAVLDASQAVARWRRCEPAGHRPL